MANKIQNKEIYIYIYIYLLVDEACWCCSKLFHLHKKVGKEFNGQGKTTRGDNEQQGSEAKMRGAQEVFEKGKE